MEKDKFISKFNIKDYNNQLENILAKKTFSEDTKNLLLNMLYKIENAYNDYHRVNIYTKNKKEILEEILNIIEKECETIEIVREKKSSSIKKEKKIVTYLNDKKMLYEIYQLKNKEFKVLDNYSIIKPSIENTLNQAYSIANSEIIRDFDGWSWNIIPEEIENLIANLLYQILRILIGNKFLIEWQEDENNQDYIAKLLEKLEIKYKTELGEQLYKHINQIAIINYINQNGEELKRLIEIEKELQKEYDEIDDKEKYLKKLADSKKKLNSEIKNIDKIINDDKLLKKEFISRNELLDMDNRIFSLSDLVDILQLERKKLIKELNEFNKKMEPLNFIKTKTDLANKLNLVKELHLQKNDEKIYNTKIEELLKLVIKAITIQVGNAEGKERIIDLIYIIRYYGLIYVNKNKQVKDIIDLDKIQMEIITKACRQKNITIFSKNIKENYSILKNIFKVDIIELEKIYFKILLKKEKLLLEIYDEENIYKAVELPIIKELNVKLNKKIRVINS